MSDDFDDYDQASAVDIDAPIPYVLLWLVLFGRPIAATKECPCHVTMTWCLDEPLPPFAITLPIAVIRPSRRHPSFGRG